MAFLLTDYKDIKEIGRGGMGKVYLATQISLARKVVIKEMAAGLLTNATEIRRFENEARAAAALDHDNIIRIYDFGEDGGSFYIAMEYIDGPALESVMKEKHFVPEIGLMIVMHALRGLNYAHQHEIIHRDIKPGNILISRGGAIKVVDFGVAHASREQLHLTSTDMIVGTPLFMSPEQATGEERKDIRMDIWSVGVLLYRIVTGAYPFAGDNVPAILFHIVQSTQPSIREVVPALPEELSRTIDLTLVKDRTKRLSSLVPIIEALQNYFFEIGVRDTIEQVREHVAHPESSAKKLCRKLHEYHVRKAAELASSGDHEKGRVHEQESHRYDSGVPHTLEIEALKKHSSSSILKKSSDAGSLSNSDAWKTLSRLRPSRIALVAMATLALVVGSGMLLYHQRSRDRTEEQRIATVISRVKQQDAHKKIGAADSSAATDGHRAGAPAAENPSAAVKRDSAPSAGVRPQTARQSGPSAAKARSPREEGRRSTEKSASQLSASASGAGKLKVTITPDSAEVLLDGKRMTAQEMSLGKELKTGTHQLTALFPGYNTYVKTVTIEKGAVQIVTADLTPIEKGVTAAVHIHSYPWADIYIDGAYQGTSPTPKPLLLSEGTHLVMLKRNGYKTHQETITVSKGELKRIKLQLMSEASK